MSIKAGDTVKWCEPVGDESPNSRYLVKWIDGDRGLMAYLGELNDNAIKPHGLTIAPSSIFRVTDVVLA